MRIVAHLRFLTVILSLTLQCLPYSASGCHDLFGHQSQPLHIEMNDNLRELLWTRKRLVVENPYTLVTDLAREAMANVNDRDKETVMDENLAALIRYAVMESVRNAGGKTPDSQLAMQLALDDIFYLSEVIVERLRILRAQTRSLRAQSADEPIEKARFDWLRDVLMNYGLIRQVPKVMQ